MLGALKKLFGVASSKPTTTAAAPPPEVKRQAVRALTEDVVTGYRPSSPLLGWWDGASNLPNLWQQLQDVEAMLAHPRVSTALAYYKSGISGAEIEIEDASTPEHGEFALSEAKRFWARGRTAAQRSYEYGRGGCQAVYSTEEGPLRLERMDAFHPLDTVVLLRNKGRQFAGVRVRPQSGASEDLWPGGYLPGKGFWFSHNVRYNRWYGMPQTYPAWRPWRRLAGRDGAEEFVDGGLYRFAYCGPVGRFPMEDNISTGQPWGTDAPAGQVLSNHDKMREFVESAKAGVSIAMSSRRDEHGQYMWDVSWPERTLNVDGLLNYVAYLEKAVTLGIGVPPELLEASEVGSGYSGRAIPLEGYFEGQQLNADLLLHAWAWQIGTPLLRWNYGPGAWARLRVKRLLESRMKALGGQQQQPGADQQPPEQPGRPPAGPASMGTRFATEADPWKPYRGARGGKGWKNSTTGRIVYGDRKPGGPRGTKADPAQVKARLEELLSGGGKRLTAARIKDAVEDLMTLSASDMKALAASLGSRRSGTKREIAAKIVEAARVAGKPKTAPSSARPKPRKEAAGPPGSAPRPAGKQPGKPRPLGKHQAARARIRVVNAASSNHPSPQERAEALADLARLEATPGALEKTWKDVLAHRSPFVGYLPPPTDAAALGANLKAIWQHADWMWADVPASEAKEHALRHFPQLKHVEQQMRLEDVASREAKQNVYDLARLPEPILQALAGHGLREVVIGSRSTARLDDNADLMHERPRGWSEGKTWDDVGGAYRPSKQQVVAGKAASGSAALAVHETGHAIGDVLGWNDDPGLDEQHRALYERLPPYLAQGGPGGEAGKHELLAEGLAVLIAHGPERAAQQFSPEFVEYLKRGPLSGKRYVVSPYKEEPEGWVSL